MIIIVAAVAVFSSLKKLNVTDILDTFGTFTCKFSTVLQILVPFHELMVVQVYELLLLRNVLFISCHIGTISFASYPLDLRMYTLFCFFRSK